MFAGRLLKLCWKFAGLCKHSIRPTFAPGNVQTNVGFPGMGLFVFELRSRVATDSIS